MSDPVHLEAAEQLLQAMHAHGSGGHRHSFISRRPGAPAFGGGLGAEVFYDRRRMIQAAHYVRQNGPAYLKYLDIGDVWSLLTDFVGASYWLLQGEVWGRRFEGAYAAQVSPAAKAAFAEALGQSSLFAPRLETTLFPLVTIRVEAAFSCDSVFLCAPGELAHQVADAHPERWLRSDTYPPLIDTEMRRRTPASWLGIRAPTLTVARRMLAGVLGAVALTPQPRDRHMFSGREMFGGHCTIGERISFGGQAPHTPPLMDDILLQERDHPWLTEVGRMLASGDPADRRKLFALEYFYRAWPLDKAARFPVFCMALDGVYGDASQATKSVIEGVQETLGDQIDARRLRDLMSLRGSVIHGGAPDVYDSSSYAKYYERYVADPVFDLELVVAGCLRARIFGEAMGPYRDPHAAQVAELRVRGRLPADLYEGAILSPVVEAAVSPAEPQATRR